MDDYHQIGQCAKNTDRFSENKVYRYMNESQKEEKTKRKISHLKDEVHAARKEVEKFKERIDEITAAQGIVLDETLQRDLYWM